MRILLDGWSLIHDPAAPAALHLAAVLATLPEEVEATLVIPGPDPGIDDLPAGVQIQFHETRRTSWGLLTWQQIKLPQLAAQTGSSLIYTASAGASLFGRAATIASPSSWLLTGSGQPSGSGGAKNFKDRIQEAVGMGGLTHARAVFWPDDLPMPDSSLPFVSIPPLIHPLFQSNQPSPAIEFWPGVDLPQTYILYHGPLDQTSIEHLLEAWSWAAGSIGTYYPLLLYGGLENQQHWILETARRLGLDENLFLLPPGSPVQLAALYCGCSALFQPGPISPWGDPVHHAMSCAKPVVAADNLWSAARLGSSGFLAPATDLRALGAALITVIVEDDLAERLAVGAKQRVKSWNPSDFWQLILNPDFNQRIRDNKPT